jgi:hypothetical protein
MDSERTSPLTIQHKIDRVLIIWRTGDKNRQALKQKKKITTRINIQVCAGRDKYKERPEASHKPPPISFFHVTLLFAGEITDVSPSLDSRHQFCKAALGVHHSGRRPIV